MRTVIPCRITYSKEDAVWYVEFPDLYEGIATYGETLEEAKNRASDAVSGLLEAYLDAGEEVEIPAITDDPDMYPIEPASGVAFALWLRNKRKKSGMTLSDVAEKLGVKYQVYQKLENPERSNPTLKTIRKLEKVFNETILEF